MPIENVEVWIGDPCHSIPDTNQRSTPVSSGGSTLPSGIRCPSRSGRPLTTEQPQIEPPSPRCTTDAGRKQTRRIGGPPPIQNFGSQHQGPIQHGTGCTMHFRETAPYTNQ
jgi:hypothetical protein